MLLFALVMIFISTVILASGTVFFIYALRKNKKTETRIIDFLQNETRTANTTTNHTSGKR